MRRLRLDRGLTARRLRGRGMYGFRSTKMKRILAVIAMISLFGGAAAAQDASQILVRWDRLWPKLNQLSCERRPER